MCMQDTDCQMCHGYWLHSIWCICCDFSGLSNSLSDQLNETANTKILRLELENNRLQKQLEDIKQNSLLENTSKMVELERENHRLAKKVINLQPSFIYALFIQKGYQCEILTWYYLFIRKPVNPNATDQLLLNFIWKLLFRVAKL